MKDGNGGWTYYDLRHMVPKSLSFCTPEKDSAIVPSTLESFGSSRLTVSVEGAATVEGGEGEQDVAGDESRFEYLESTAGGLTDSGKKNRW